MSVLKDPRRMTVEEIKSEWRVEPDRVSCGPDKGMMTPQTIKRRDALMAEWRRR